MKKKFVIVPMTALVAILAASASVSAAWFSNSNHLRIEGINIALDGTDELLISTKDERDLFKDHLTYDELNHIGYFEPVSSMYSSLWLKNSAKSPSFIDCYNSYNNQVIRESGTTYVRPLEVIANDGYYSQELFLYSSSSCLAYIDTANTFFIPNLRSNREAAKRLAQDNGKNEDDIYEDLNKIVNSCRFSVLVDTDEKYDYKIIDPTKNGTTSLGGLLDSDLNGLFDCATDFIDSNRYEALYGEVNDRTLIKYKDVSVNASYEGENTCFNAGHEQQAKQIDFVASIANGLSIKDEDTLSFEEMDSIREKLLIGRASKEEIDKMLLIPVLGGQATRIVLSIYIEGWDIDNINDTMAASFISNISFGTLDRNLVR